MVERTRHDEIVDLVTADMRNAAIKYWYSVNHHAVGAPIGEINGIIYAALGAADFVERLLKKQ